MDWEWGLISAPGHRKKRPWPTSNPLSKPGSIFQILTRPGAKYIEKYSNTLQLLSLINDYTGVTNYHCTYCLR